MKIKIDKKIIGIKVIPTFSKKDKVKFFTKEKLEKEILKKLKNEKFKSENGEICQIKLNKNIILIGLKEEYSNEDLRNAYSNLFRYINSKVEKEFSIVLPKEDQNTLQCIVEGLDLTNYKFDKYLSNKSKEEKKEINIITDSKFKSTLNKTLKITNNVKYTRDLVNDNADVITPKKLESEVRSFANKNKLKFKSLNEKQIQKEKLNLLWAVGQGSKNPPRLIICEYKGNPKSKKKIALVGKGITFDTGGLNLKPTGYIEDMKFDMGGSATVLGAFKAAVETKVKKNIILVLACAENAVGSKAYKPGDIFTSHKGLTVYIGNTDAEGRLVLCDALSYVQKYYKPDEIIDVATLTGAVMVSLGKTLIGILGNNEETMKKIHECGEETGDRGWPLPIHDEHREMMKGKFSDLTNSGGRYGGTLTAGAFLEKFINEKVTWSHLDIAGAADTKVDKYYNKYGATGKGVRLLVNYLEK